MKINKRARRRLTTAALTILAAGLVALWAIPAAYAERGYQAVGGEWVLIAAAGVGVHMALRPRPKARRVAYSTPTVRRDSCERQSV